MTWQDVLKKKFPVNRGDRETIYINFGINTFKVCKSASSTGFYLDVFNIKFNNSEDEYFPINSNPSPLKQTIEFINRFSNIEPKECKNKV